MSDSSSSSGGGIGFAGLLTVLFIGLKLTEVIAWSWWWVLSPMWISLILAAVILLVAFFIAAFASCVVMKDRESHFERKKE